DSLLGAVPYDYDVATSALPDRVLSLFSKTVATGIKHGTVTVIIDGDPIEVTTFRTENEYKDHRHPEAVNYVSDVKADLSRRDFTVNAMCYNDISGLVDIFGGEADLKAKTLRAVGCADTRFKEDALRILRLFRFASTLGFTAEAKTLAAALENAKLLKSISAERIQSELLRLSCGSNPTAVLPLLKTAALPCFKANPEIEKIPLLPDNKRLRFFAFLALTSDNLAASLEFLKCSNAFKKYALGLSGAVNLRHETRADIKRLLNAMGDDVFDLLCYKSVILGCDTKNAERQARDVIESGEPYEISGLDIGGDDIAALGFSGKEINDTLLKLLDAVMENPELNRKETLISLTRSN
ncbi:MAG: CCA tRNA nucleotidyltransferase, partial [Clostridia bacterium]|nr:CCA tRNA nucleotidyltransferase [Clostridia bacterium]